MSYIVKQIDIKNKEWFFEFFHDLCNKFDHHDTFSSLEDIEVIDGTYANTEIKICVGGKASLTIGEETFPIKEGTYFEIEKDIPFSFSFHREEWESGINLLRFFNSDSLIEEGEGVRF